MPTALIRHYLRTEYEAAGAVVRIGRRSAEVDGLLLAMRRGSGGFVTGWNPRSRRMPDGWNRRMQKRLEEAVRRLPSAPGNGSARGWREEHMLVGADPRRLFTLARRFRQRAIVVVRRGQPARLVTLQSQRPACPVRSR
jgi:hypothetical protein